MLDVILLNGTIVDGTGQEAFVADLGLKGDRIARIGNLKEEAAKRIIDVTGKTVTPGFINIHDHSDTTVLAGHQLDSYSMQGVTTVLSGQCGFSPAPVKNEEDFKKITDCLPEWELKPTWNDFASYLDTVEDAKPGINFACMVGHGAIRTAVMGFANRKATEEEIHQMEVLLEESLAQGAYGFSTGLEYMPGASASYEELLALCKVTAKAGKLYATHQRDRDLRFEASLKESLQLAKDSAVRLQISHTAPRWWAKEDTARMVTSLIEEARAEGMEVACDYIISPYSTCYLSSFLPSWAFDHGIDGLETYLKDATARERMKSFDDHILGGIVRKKAWDKVILCSSTSYKEYIGKSLEEIGNLLQCDPQDAILDIVGAEKENFLSVSVHVMTTSEDDLCAMMIPEYSFPEPDVWGMSMYDKLKGNVMSGLGGYSWTCEYLTKFIREKTVLSLEEGIRRITALPAEQMYLEDRGMIKEGYYADLVVMDYPRLKTMGTEVDPNHYPRGFVYVFVNGMPVVKEGELTGICAGKVLRR